MEDVEDMMLERVVETFGVEVIVCVTVGPVSVDVTVAVVVVAAVDDFRRYPAAPPMTRPPTTAAAATAPVAIACLLDKRLLRMSIPSLSSSSLRCSLEL